METIWLFRHAESEFNTRQSEYVGGRSNESPLSPKGEIQAARLGLWIASNGLIPDAVYASPAVRTRETARISLQQAGIDMPVTIDDELQEMSQGPAEGSLREHVYTKKVLEQIQAELMGFKLPGGESMNDVAGRGVRAIETMRTQNPGATVLAYTHGFLIRCAVGQYLGWDHAAIRANDVDNAAATRLVFTQGNDTPEVTFNIDTQSGSSLAV